MWLEIEKEEILSKFSILAEHGFIFEFLTELSINVVSEFLILANGILLKIIYTRVI